MFVQRRYRMELSTDNIRLLGQTDRVSPLQCAKASGYAPCSRAGHQNVAGDFDRSRRRSYLNDRRSIVSRRGDILNIYHFVRLCAQWHDQQQRRKETHSSTRLYSPSAYRMCLMPIRPHSKSGLARDCSASATAVVEGCGGHSRPFGSRQYSAIDRCHRSGETGPRPRDALCSC